MLVHVRWSNGRRRTFAWYCKPRRVTDEFVLWTHVLGFRRVFEVVASSGALPVVAYERPIPHLGHKSAERINVVAGVLTAAVMQVCGGPGGAVLVPAYPSQIRAVVGASPQDEALGRVDVWVFGTGSVEYRFGRQHLKDLKIYEDALDAARASEYAQWAVEVNGVPETSDASRRQRTGSSPLVRKRT